MNLLESIKAAATAPPPSKIVPFKTPDGEIDVKVVAMTGAVKKTYRASAKDHKGDNEHHEAKLVVMSTFDPATGAAIFTDEHIPLIQAAPYLFEKVLAACNEVNGWADEGKAG